MERAQVSSWVPAEIAERISDTPFPRSEARDLDALQDTISNAESLKRILNDEELAEPLAEMVCLLEPCIREIAAQMGRVKLPNIEAMLNRVSKVERQLLVYAEDAL